MKAAILGFGTVGSGVYDVLTMNKARIAKNLGEPLDIKYVLDLREFPGNPVMDVLVHDFNVIVNDPEVDVVAEVMGGLKPAYDFTKALLEAGKAVCTSNKELVSRHGAELLRIAKEHGVNYFFEASVGGGIPVLRSICHGLAADEIEEIKSIVNGTTNYILTRMRDNGMAFEAALKEAQDNGFAERNPAADIEGMDAARKTSILASLAVGAQVDCEDIYTEGITNISATDIAYAEKLGMKIKLISYVKRDNGNSFALVAPFLVNKDCQLYNVDGVFNALLLRGNAVSDIMLYGSGAGKLPTASAVAGDLVEAARHRHETLDTIWAEEKAQLSDKSEMEYSFFVRVAEADKAKALECFGEVCEVEPVAGEYAFVTKVMAEKDFEGAADKIAIINRIRVNA